MHNMFMDFLFINIGNLGSIIYECIKESVFFPVDYKEMLKFSSFLNTLIFISSPF